MSCPLGLTVNYPGPFTPLKKPPRWPVNAVTATATASRVKRYDGSAFWGFPLLFNVALIRHLSWEGGAGERVQGARAAYGTCFICADPAPPPVIPGFFAYLSLS
jgi:hypothetical protein